MTKLERNSVQEVFLGRMVENVSVVVLTPIHHLYIDICRRLHGQDESVDGFYPNAFFRKGEENGILICCPQGLAAQDAVHLFPDTRIVFVGYAGSLTERLAIGTPVEVDKAISRPGEAFQLMCSGSFAKATVSYSPCFLGTVAEDAHAFARQNGAEVVDMETVPCAKAAHEKHCRFSAFLLITDIPGQTDVWQVDDRDKERISDGFRAILNTLDGIVSMPKSNDHGRETDNQVY